MLINFLRPRSHTETRRTPEQLLQRSKELRYQALANNDRFLRTLHPEDYAGTIKPPGFLHQVLAFVGLKPKAIENPLLTHKIPASKKVEHGLIVPAGFVLDENLLKEIIVDPAHIKPIIPKQATAIKVDLKHDKGLKTFLKSQAVQKLKREIPDENATLHEDLQFLSNLNGLTNRQFDKGFDIERQAAILDERGRAPAHSRKQYQGLGHSMEEGIGVCRHRALLNKLVIDQLDHPALKSSLMMGLLRDPKDVIHPVKDDEVHAWNTITLPSGRKYIVDPTWKAVVPVSENDSEGRKFMATNEALIQRRERYISFNHLLKGPNPNKEWEIDQELRQLFPAPRN